MNLQPKVAVSVVMALDDHPECVPAMVRAYAAQTASLDSFEVLACDSTRLVDWAPDLGALLAGECRGLSLQYLPLAASGRRASALNHGLARAQAPLILFVGDDILPEPTLIEAHLAYHRAHPEITAVGIGGACFTERLRRDPFRRWMDESGRQFGVPFHGDATQAPPHFFQIANASVKRELLNQAGPFNEAFRYHAWDDYELGVRLAACGMHARYVPGAVGWHEHEVTLAERCESLFHAGESAWLFRSIHPGQHGWMTPLQKTATEHARRACWYGWLAWLTGSARWRQRSWIAEMDAAFVAGYRAAESAAAEAPAADSVRRAA
jgi:cellulose synthase/poly-beta-1,6-N-acetylglucosamine synthase-like glycosyltransferase